jgi:opacity protein-like surface antigen
MIGKRPVARGIVIAMLLAVASRAGGQSVIERLNLDKLEIRSLGLFGGHVEPAQLENANLVAIQADYGNVSREWRVLAGGSFWQSRFRPSVVQAFADSLHKSLSDSAARVNVSPVTLYDVTFDAQLRYTPDYSGELKPFLGVGIAAHVLNADGQLIKGTFVERAIDDIATGLFVTTGVAFKIVKQLGVEGAARADLLSGFRSVQLRAGASYYFGQKRGTQPSSP